MRHTQRRTNRPERGLREFDKHKLLSLVEKYESVPDALALREMKMSHYLLREQYEMRISLEDVEFINKQFGHAQAAHKKTLAALKEMNTIARKGEATVDAATRGDLSLGEFESLEKGAELFDISSAAAAMLDNDASLSLLGLQKEAIIQSLQKIFDVVKSNSESAAAVVEALRFKRMAGFLFGSLPTPSTNRKVSLLERHRRAMSLRGVLLEDAAGDEVLLESIRGVIGDIWSAIYGYPYLAKSAPYDGGNAETIKVGLRNNNNKISKWRDDKFPTEFTTSNVKEYFQNLLKLNEIFEKIVELKQEDFKDSTKVKKILSQGNLFSSDVVDEFAEVLSKNAQASDYDDKKTKDHYRKAIENFEKFVEKIDNPGAAPDDQKKLFETLKNQLTESSPSSESTPTASELDSSSAPASGFESGASPEIGGGGETSAPPAPSSRPNPSAGSSGDPNSLAHTPDVDMASWPHLSAGSLVAKTGIEIDNKSLNLKLKNLVNKRNFYQGFIDANNAIKSALEEAKLENQATDENFEEIKAKLLQNLEIQKSNFETLQPPELAGYSAEFIDQISKFIREKVKTPKEINKYENSRIEITKRIAQRIENAKSSDDLKFKYYGTGEESSEPTTSDSSPSTGSSADSPTESTSSPSSDSPASGDSATPGSDASPSGTGGESGASDTSTTESGNTFEKFLELLKEKEPEISEKFTSNASAIDGALDENDPLLSLVARLKEKSGQKIADELKQAAEDAAKVIDDLEGDLRIASAKIKTYADNIMSLFREDIEEMRNRTENKSIMTRLSNALRFDGKDDAALVARSVAFVLALDALPAGIVSSMEDFDKRFLGENLKEGEADRQIAGLVSVINSEKAFKAYGGQIANKISIERGAAANWSDWAKLKGNLFPKYFGRGKNLTKILKAVRVSNNDENLWDQIGESLLKTWALLTPNQFKDALERVKDVVGTRDSKDRKPAGAGATPASSTDAQPGDDASRDDAGASGGEGSAGPSGSGGGGSSGSGERRGSSGSEDRGESGGGSGGGSRSGSPSRSPYSGSSKIKLDDLISQSFNVIQRAAVRSGARKKLKSNLNKALKNAGVISSDIIESNLNDNRPLVLESRQITNTDDPFERMRQLAGIKD